MKGCEKVNSYRVATLPGKPGKPGNFKNHFQAWKSLEIKQNSQKSLEIFCVCLENLIGWTAQLYFIVLGVPTVIS